MKWNEYTDQNRRAWDEIAEVRHARWPSPDFFGDGGSLLDDRITDIVGNVHGSSVCHLQCATGEDSLSWANLGAKVTGIDISAIQIKLAVKKAHDASIPALVATK